MTGRHPRLAIVGASLSVALLLLTAACGGGATHRAVVNPPSTSTSTVTTSTTTPPAGTPTTPPASAPPQATTSTTATILPPPQITGRVTGPEGRPVPLAVIIDANTLQVFHADGLGRYTIPYCGTLDQYWVANWIIPLGTPYPTPYGQTGNAGGSTTYFGPPPTVAGPGYAQMDHLWARAATDPAPCRGQEVDVQLPAGGTVDITWMRKTGTAPPTILSGPVAGYYEILPGLPYNAGLYTPTPDATGHQVLAQLGAGGLAVNSSTKPFTCTGGGIAKTSGSSWQVPVVAGQTARVTCTVP